MNQQHTLKFSIVVPVHNRERYVAETLHSVLAQDGDDFEVIVVDDGSTDRSAHIVEDLKDPRIRLIRAAHGGGPAARNTGIANALGQFIVWIDSDDRQPPGALALLRRTMAEHPDADIYYGDLEIFEDQAPGRRWKTEYPDYHGTSLLPLLIRGNCLPNPGTAVRRSLYDQHGGYDARFPRCHDFHIWSRLADTARFKKVPGVLCHWRRHAASLSHTPSRRFEAEVAREMAERYPPSRLYTDLADDAAGRAEALSRTAATIEALGEADIALRVAYAAAASGAEISPRLQALERKVGTAYRPAFTVVVTTFNRPQLLRDALDSLERQDFRDFEVVVVNDAGEDIETILRGYSYRMTYVRQPCNMGPAAARNAAHRLAAGDYLLYLDDDDVFLPDHLQTLAEALQEHPEKVVYSDAVFITEQLEGDARQTLHEDHRYRHEEFSRERLSVDNYIPVNTFAWPRALLPEVGGFDESMTGLEDWDFLLRLAARADFVHVPRRTVEVRMRVAGGAEARRSEHAFKDYPTLYKEIYARHPDLDSEVVRQERARKLEALGAAEPPAAGLSSEQWLGQRVPNSAQAALIGRMLQDHGNLPWAGVLVLDRNGDTDALHRTLRSLQPDHAGYPNLKVAVLRSTGDDCAELGSALAHVAQLEDRAPATSLNEAAAALGCDWIIQVEAGEEFTASGLYQLMHRVLSAAGGLRAIYADEMMTLPAGGLVALLRPALNLDMLLSAPSSMAHHWLFNYEVFRSLGGFPIDRGQSHEFALILRLINDGGLAGLEHCAEPLLITGPQALVTRQEETDAITEHLHLRGYQNATVRAQLPGCYRIHYGHADTAGVSIIVPTRNQFALLQRCIEGILEKTAYQNYEVIIVDNGSTDEDACAWLDGIAAMGSLQLRVLRHPGKFDYSSMINTAASHARGDYLLLLDNDTAVLQEDWLEALLNHAQRPEVGVVGPKLVLPDGSIQQAGMVLGFRGPAGPAFAGEKLDAPGYMHRLQVDQDYSAVCGSCMMVRKAVFEEVGGLTGGALANTYSDVDFCLKVGQAGYLVVWTPHVTVLHEGGASQAREDRSSVEEKARLLIENQDAMYAKWLPLIAKDRAYNPNLSLHGSTFQLATDNTFNWDPMPWRPLPVALAIPADRHGCGHYRVIQPAMTMARLGVADARVGSRYPTPVELERLAPDVIVLQRQMLKEQLEPQKRMLRFSRSFKVAELDDYLPNVPTKSVHRGQLPNDVLRGMREALKLVDRFIVSTAPLAEALAGLHPDIRVVHNHLPVDWWGSLQPRRRAGERPRVGWAGGAGHRGDLEMVADVVRALADEVEWVFFGMCPEGMRPFVHEFHQGVPIEQYPARLAGLDLDLALAPLEDNQFNRCKSNLRLLEYGACGYPVVCSNVGPYQEGLPVTRVKPRFKEWVEAIRMHTHDLDAAARAGDALREAVHRDWMLDAEKARAWLANWMPD